MERKEILTEVEAVLRKYKGDEKLTITEETRFEELELDSLDTVDLVMEIEDSLEVQIEMSKAIQTVAHIVDIISKQKK
jgi:acyl carrier protein